MKPVFRIQRTPLGDFWASLRCCRWMQPTTWARQRCTGPPAAVTCRPAGCCWALAPTRCCRPCRGCQRHSWVVRACRRCCRVSLRAAESACERPYGSAEPLTFLSAEGVVVGNSEVDRQLLEASKTGDLETVKVKAATVPVTGYTWCNKVKTTSSTSEHFYCSDKLLFSNDFRTYFREWGVVWFDCHRHEWMLLVLNSSLKQSSFSSGH